MARHGAKGRLWQAGLDLLLKLCDGSYFAAQAQDLGDLARLDDGCIHAAHSQLIDQSLSSEMNTARAALGPRARGPPRRCEELASARQVQLLLFDKPVSHPDAAPPQRAQRVIPSASHRN